MTVDLPYAGFWPRLRAGLVDFAVFAPTAPLSLWSIGEGPRTAAVVQVVGTIVYFAYAIVGHALWGQTLGKRVVGIRVLDTAGGPCRWGRAWRRSAVDIVLGTFSVISYLAVLSGIPAAEFDLGWIHVQERHDAIRPWWAAVAEYAYLAWLGSEVVSVLFNRRRRALHDYVAGTVVVYVKGRPEPRPPLPPVRRVLLWADGIASIAAAMVTVLCAFAALAIGNAPSSDASTRVGFVIFAALAGLVAATFGVAARAAYRGSRRLWLAQSAAVAIAVLAAALVVLPLVAQ